MFSIFDLAWDAMRPLVVHWSILKVKSLRMIRMMRLWRQPYSLLFCIANFQVLDSDMNKWQMCEYEAFVERQPPPRQCESLDSSLLPIRGAWKSDLV